jgi:hypothetical protein
MEGPMDARERQAMRRFVKATGRLVAQMDELGKVIRRAASQASEMALAFERSRARELGK